LIRDKVWDNFTQRGKSPANSYPCETYQHGPAAIICLASFAYAQVPEIINNDLIVYNVYKACVPADSIYYFAGHDGDYDNELWRTNGTPEGTYRVANVNQGGPANPNEFTMVGDQLFFLAADDNGTEQLYKSDGTADGTYMLKNINEEPGAVAYHSYPARFFVTDDLLYFVANDGVHGAELWQTDGTTDGTVMTADIWASGNQGSDPGGFAEVGDYLVFNAWYGKRTLLRLKIHNTSTTSLENNLSEPALFRIYPNPAHAVLYIEPCQETGFQYLVYDLKGREVMNGRLLDAGRVTLDISMLPPGLYMLRARNTGSCQTVRFAVQ
jgi:ELWxxDGT repeat protein